MTDPCAWSSLQWKHTERLERLEALIFLQQEGELGHGYPPYLVPSTGLLEVESCREALDSDNVGSVFDHLPSQASATQPVTRNMTQIESQTDVIQSSVKSMEDADVLTPVPLQMDATQSLAQDVGNAGALTSVPSQRMSHTYSLTHSSTGIVSDTGSVSQSAVFSAGFLAHENSTIFVPRPHLPSHRTFHMSEGGVVVSGKELDMDDDAFVRAKQGIAPDAQVIADDVQIHEKRVQDEVECGRKARELFCSEENDQVAVLFESDRQQALQETHPRDLRREGVPTISTAQVHTDFAWGNKTQKLSTMADPLDTLISADSMMPSRKALQDRAKKVMDDCRQSGVVDDSSLNTMRDICTLLKRDNLQQSGQVRRMFQKEAS